MLDRMNLFIFSTTQTSSKFPIPIALGAYWFAGIATLFDRLNLVTFGALLVFFWVFAAAVITKWLAQLSTTCHWFDPMTLRTFLVLVRVPVMIFSETRPTGKLCRNCVFLNYFLLLTNITETYHHNG